MLFVCSRRVASGKILEATFSGYISKMEVTKKGAFQGSVSRE